MKKIEISKDECALVQPGAVIYLISTISKTGLLNIAPYGMVISVSYNPPTYALSSDKDRDTYRNIIETKEFVLNIPTTSQIREIDLTAGKFPPQVNEFEVANLTPLNSLKVRPPRIKECRAHIECRLSKVIDLNRKEVIIIGKVVSLSLDKELYQKDFAQQKGLLDPVMGIRPNYGKVFYFGLGRFVGKR